MRAIQINAFGGPEVIELNDNAKRPALEPKQVIIKVHSASINPVDSAIRQGYLQKMMSLPFPITLGGDFSGTIFELGADVEGFKIGDEVYGNAGPFRGGSGSFAEFLVTNSNNIAKKPVSINITNAAAIPLVGTCALQAIEEDLKIKKGDKILIRGGGGGIGSIAIQLAKLKGAHVATTVSKDDIAYVKSLGADEVFDYKTQDVTKLLKDYDAVFETARAEDTNNLLNVLKKGGKFVSVTTTPDEALAKKHGVEIIPFMSRATKAQLDSLSKLLDSGKLKVRVAKTFEFPKIKEAFSYFETEHPRGKVVLSM